MARCEKCGEPDDNNLRHKLKLLKWCKPCRTNDLKSFTNCSGNEKIDNLIQNMQLKISSPLDIVFEWIPCSQFNDIKGINNDRFATIYSAIWKS